MLKKIKLNLCKILHKRIHGFRRQKDKINRFKKKGNVLHFLYYIHNQLPWHKPEFFWCMRWQGRWRRHWIDRRQWSHFSMKRNYSQKKPVLFFRVKIASNPFKFAFLSISHQNPHESGPFNVMQPIAEPRKKINIACRLPKTLKVIELFSIKKRISPLCTGSKK